MRLQTSRYAAHRRGVIEPSKLPLIRAQLEQERWFRLEQLASLAGDRQGQVSCPVRSGRDQGRDRAARRRYVRHLPDMLLGRRMGAP